MYVSELILVELCLVARVLFDFASPIRDRKPTMISHETIAEIIEYIEDARSIDELRGILFFHFLMTTLMTSEDKFNFYLFN